MSTADYSGHSLAFKLRKVARYIRIYGPGRTWVKVVGPKHLAATKAFEDVDEPAVRATFCAAPLCCDRRLRLFRLYHDRVLPGRLVQRFPRRCARCEQGARAVPG
jgi:hypothetical protein